MKMQRNTSSYDQKLEKKKEEEKFISVCLHWLILGIVFMQF